MKTNERLWRLQKQLEDVKSKIKEAGKSTPIEIDAKIKLNNQYLDNRMNELFSKNTHFSEALNKIRKKFDDQNEKNQEKFEKL
jgi:hypothetical protein